VLGTYLTCSSLIIIPYTYLIYFWWPRRCGSVDATSRKKFYYTCAGPELIGQSFCWLFLSEFGPKPGIHLSRPVNLIQPRYYENSFKSWNSVLNRLYQNNFRIERGILSFLKVAGWFNFDITNPRNFESVDEGMLNASRDCRDSWIS